MFDDASCTTIDGLDLPEPERVCALTRAPLFAHKAKLFPGSTFVVGADTAIRLVNPKYYGASRLAMAFFFDELQGRGCSFLVAGRLSEATGRFETLADVKATLTAEEWGRFGELFDEIPEAEFRVDLSSSALRRVARSSL